MWKKNKNKTKDKKNKAEQKKILEDDDSDEREKRKDDGDDNNDDDSKVRRKRRDDDDDDNDDDDSNVRKRRDDVDDDDAKDRKKRSDDDDEQIKMEGENNDKLKSDDDDGDSEKRKLKKRRYDDDNKDDEDYKRKKKRGDDDDDNRKKRSDDDDDDRRKKRRDGDDDRRRRRKSSDDDDEDDDDKKGKKRKSKKNENAKECQTNITLDPDGYPPIMDTNIQTSCTIAPINYSDTKVTETIRRPYKHKRISRRYSSDSRRDELDEDEEELEVEERRLIPPSIIEPSSYARTIEPEFQIATIPTNTVSMNNADFQRRVENCETYNEKQLLLGVSDTIKTLMIEMNNLRSLYDKVCKEQDSHLDKKLHEAHDSIEQISELDKYAYDLLTHDADEFPLSVVITDSYVLKHDEEEENKLKFDLPARNIQDFNNLYIDALELSSKPMMDTDLLEPPGILDRNVFTVGSLIPGAMDPLAVKPMWDTNLTNDEIPSQVGLTWRRDRTVFLEDYIQYVMQDKDLLMKPMNDNLLTTPDKVSPIPEKKQEITPDKSKSRPEIKYRLQMDTDLGRPPPRIRSLIKQKILDCKCQMNDPMVECTCGCPTNHFICDMNIANQNDNVDDDNLSCVSVESDVTVPRGMFDYDLYGNFIRKIQRKSVYDVMWDYNLCHSVVSDSNVNDSKLNDSFDNQYKMQRAMFDFDLCDESMIDPKVYLDRRAMFDFDLGHDADTSTYSDSDDMAMMDYHLKGQLINRTYGTLSPTYLKRLNKGQRGMFDVDLHEVNETDQYLSYSDEESSDSVPQPMWDCDVGKKFVPLRKRERSVLKNVTENSSEGKDLPFYGRIYDMTINNAHKMKELFIYFIFGYCQNLKQKMHDPLMFILN